MLPRFFLILCRGVNGEFVIVQRRPRAGVDCSHLAADPDGRAAGAHSGDSGAPIWSGDVSATIAIVAWAQAPHGDGCGGLDARPLLVPLKGWIGETERSLASPR